MTEQIESPEQRAFALYHENQKNVYAAVWRTGLVKHEADPRFSDLAEEGMWLYVDFYLHYQGSLNNVQDLAVFNRLATKAVTWGLMRQHREDLNRRRLAHESVTDPALRRELVPAPDGDWDATELGGALYAQLTRGERRVFELLFAGNSPNEVAQQLRRTPQRIRQVRKAIQAKYLALLADTEEKP